MSKDTVLIIGGGNNQLQLIKEARARELRIVVTDMFSDPPAKKLADKFFQIDTTDRTGTLEIARLTNIAAVVTDQSDVAVPTAAYVAERLGLPGIGFETSLKFTNKYVMRTALQLTESDLLPKSTFFKESSELFDFLKKSLINPTELLVKPINSQGSKGVARLRTHDNTDLILVAFREARGQGVLLESFITGDEFSVEAFVVDGEVTNLAVTRKFHFPQNDCIDFRNTYLGDVSMNLQQRLYEANSRVIASLGLNTGSTHAEFKVDANNICLMEIAARGGGGNISSKIIPYLTGFSPTAALLDFALGKTPEVKVDDYRRRFAILRFFDFHPGTVSHVSTHADHIAGLLHFELNLSAGNQVRPILSSRDRVGYFIVADEERNRTLELEEQVLDSVDIEILV